MLAMARKGYPLKMLSKRQVEQDANLQKTDFSKNGERLSPTYILPKLIWMAKRAERFYQQVDKFLLPLDFIQNKLCEKITTDHNMAMTSRAGSVAAE